MVNFNPPLEAFDQDKGINASLEYSILQGKLNNDITTWVNFTEYYNYFIPKLIFLVYI